jgi:tRNA pseudouridine38-40 synthase
MDVAYDGSSFHGYARQPDVPTVQAALEDAMESWIGPVETSVAGRTDKGVHALGQVISFRTDQAVDTIRLSRSLNRRLRPAISVLAFAPVADGFHARHSATGRRYRYQVLNREAPDPFLATTSWHLTTPLDLEQMNRSIRPLLGVNDFASFCKKSATRGTVRDLRSLEWTVGPGGLMVLEVHASSFCHQMVRSIVAASVDVGRSVIPVERVGEILAAQDRTQGRGAAPARGLMLVGVDYD